MTYNLDKYRPQQNKAESLASGFVSNSVAPVETQGLAMSNTEVNRQTDVGLQNRMMDMVSASNMPPPSNVVGNYTRGMPDGDYEGYINSLRREESGGRVDAVSPSGNHFGMFQFDEGTAAPHLKQIGKTFEEFKANGGIQEDVVRMSTRSNAALLKANGMAVTPENLFFVHNLGRGGGINLLNGGYVNPNHIKSNQANSREEYIAHWKDRFSR